MESLSDLHQPILIEENEIEAQIDFETATQMFTCNICYEEFDLSQTQVKMLDTCKHAFCAECFKETYRAKIEDQNMFEKLNCPQSDCNATPSLKEIMNIIDDNCFEKYQKFKKNRMVSQHKTLFFCPTTDCETVLNKNSDLVENYKIKCEKCETEVCTRCNQFFHEGQTCNQI